MLNNLINLNVKNEKDGSNQIIPFTIPFTIRRHNKLQWFWKHAASGDGSVGEEQSVRLQQFLKHF